MSGFNVGRRMGKRETPLSKMPVGTLINITVNGIVRPFIVVHQGAPSAIYDTSFNDGTILLMRDLYESRQWHSSQVNDYANSTIHNYLNKEFVGLIGEKIRNRIVQVKIPYRPGSVKYDTTIYSGANGLPAHVWLLGGYEVNWTTATNQYFPVDGATLSYFVGTASTDARRIGYLNGTATNWWLRSPGVQNVGPAWYVDPNGSPQTYPVDSLYGIRPTLVLPGSMLAHANPNPDGSYDLIA